MDPRTGVNKPNQFEKEIFNYSRLIKSDDLASFFRPVDLAEMEGFFAQLEALGLTWVVDQLLVAVNADAVDRIEHQEVSRGLGHEPIQVLIDFNSILGKNLA
jgi:hypothetical protein